MALDDSIMQKIKGYYNLNDSKHTVHVRKKKKRLFSTIQEVQIHGVGPSGKIRLYVKRYRKGCFSDIRQRVKNEYLFSKKCQELLGEDVRFNVINYITYDPDELVLISEQCGRIDLIKFQMLYTVFKNRICQIFYDCGHLLKKIHSISNQLQPFQFVKLTEYIRFRLIKLLECDGKYFTTRNQIEILKLLQNLNSQFRHKELLHVEIHGDYTPYNIRVSGNKLYLLDFCNHRNGLPCEDIAYFLTYTLIECVRYGPNYRKYKTLRLHFLKGYDTTIDVSLLDLFILKHLINFAWGTLMRMQRNKISKFRWLISRRLYIKTIREIQALCGKYRVQIS